MAAIAAYRKLRSRPVSQTAWLRGAPLLVYRKLRSAAAKATYTKARSQSVTQTAWLRGAPLLAYRKLQSSAARRRTRKCGRDQSPKQPGYEARRCCVQETTVIGGKATYTKARSQSVTQTAWLPGCEAPPLLAYRKLQSTARRRRTRKPGRNQ